MNFAIVDELLVGQEHPCSFLDLGLRIPVALLGITSHVQRPKKPRVN